MTSAGPDRGAPEAPAPDATAASPGTEDVTSDGVSSNDVTTVTTDDATADDATADTGNGSDEPVAGAGKKRRRGSGDAGTPRTGRRLSVPLVPALLVVLLLLLGATAYLWLTRPEESAVRTADYVDALQAARSGVVDMTSFDYLTLDDDIEQIRRVSTGDLREEAVSELDASHQSITDAQAVVNTEVVGAGVTRADDAAATVWLVIESTQESSTSEQAQVVRYRIEVELQKPDERWLLSGIKGTGVENE